MLEKGAPALRGAVAAQLLHSSGSWAHCFRTAAAKAEQWERFLWFHSFQAFVAAACCALMVWACLIVLHRTFEWIKSAIAKLGSSKLGAGARALEQSSVGMVRGQCSGVLLLWLIILRAPIAATLPLEVGRPDAERGEVASGVPPSSAIDGVDFTFVTPGSFDKPLDFLGTPGGSHGRALSEGCVSAAPCCACAALQQLPLPCQSPWHFYRPGTRIGSQPTSRPP